MHGATIKKIKYRSLKLSLSLFSYSLNFVYGCVWFYRCNLPSGTVSRIWQVPPGTLHLCWPTNAVFKLVTMYILTIDVFETLVVHTKKNLNHIRESGRSYIINFFFFATIAPTVPVTPHSRGFYITHNDAPQSVGLFWTSD